MPETAGKQINKLNFLIEDLLDVTKMQAGKLVLKPSRFSMLQALNEWAEDATSFANKHQIIIEADEDCQIEGDRNRLEQVVVNLLSNAIKYSPNADKVCVTMKKEANIVKVCVIDFGIGIEKDKLQFVFDRFFRVKEEQSITGLGLGLYISFQIIKLHGGTLSVTSEEDKGSCFWFTLPLKHQPAMVL